MQKVTGSTPVTSTKVRLVWTFFMNTFFVYIIYSQLLDRYYIGYTVDLEKRIAEHQKGISIYTSKASDWTLKHYELYPNRESAMQREREIKRKKSRKYIEWLVHSSV